MNKMAKNFFSVSFSNLIGQVFTFLIGWYAAKKLTSSAFGDLMSVQAIIVYFSIIVVFGLQNYGTREVVKYKERIPKIVGEILTFRIFIFLISYVCIYILYLKLQNDVITKNLLIIYGVTLLPTCLSLDWVFNGIEKMNYNAVYNVIKTLIPCVLTFILVKDSKDINLIPIFTIIALTLGSIYQIYTYIFKLKLKIEFQIDFSKYRSYFLFGLPFVLSGILATINTNVDRLVIEFTISSSAAGIYSVSYYVVSFLTTVVTFIFVPVFPMLVDLYHKKEITKMEKLTDNLAKVVIMVILPITIGGILLSKEIILLFGQKYITAYLPFSILMIYTFLLFIRELYGYGLNAWHMEKKYLRVVAVSALLNLTLNLIFTPRFGMNIAAIITVISEVINLILMKHYAEKVVKISSFKYILKALIPTLIMTVVVLLFKFLSVNIIINIIVSAIVYIAAIIGFKYMSIDEIKSFLLRKNGV